MNTWNAGNIVTDMLNDGLTENMTGSCCNWG